MGKLSGLPQDSAPVSGDWVIGIQNSSSTDVKITMASLITLIADNISGSSFNPYKFSAYRNGAWTSPNNTTAILVFDTELYDTSSNYSTSSGKFVAPINGFYHFSSTVNYGLNTGALGAIALIKNGSTNAKSGNEFVNAYTGGAITCGFCVSGDLELNAGDFIQVDIGDGSGNAGSTGIGATFFDGYLISAT